ncbi:MAG: glycosyltransferase [Gammaproteobacteria bacterium]|nr:glycosyltransferase [Gammaproteobacteria bacterium]
MNGLESALIAVQQTWLYQAVLLFFASYPVITSLMWVTTSLLFVLRWERRDIDVAPGTAREFLPLVSVIIPAHNEQGVIARSLAAVCRMEYPRFEIFVVNDGSTDETVAAVLPYTRAGRVRLLDKRVNEGKALAINDALPLAQGEIVLTLDADAEPAPDLLTHIVPHFRAARVAAVTGNPRVRNTDTFLTRLQAIEFTSIISLLRRSQRIWGRIVTVSGVVAAFRRNALFDVGGFSPDMPTEDIEVTWKLQRRFYDVRYEPNAIVWMTVPRTLRPLFRQRRRWARGLIMVLRRHAAVLRHWRFRRMWPIFVESTLSILWALCFVVLTLLWTASWAVGYPPVGASPIPNFWGMTIGTLCLLQLGVGTLVDRRYDRDIWRYFPYAIWYPLVYWALLAVTTVISLRWLFAAPLRTPVTWNTRREGGRA